MAPTQLSHYRLLALIGVGGMGEVYRAEDTRLRREVAIKLLHPEAAASREWLGRFTREARLASSLQHPHICTIHELGEHAGQPFIVMERLEGATMRELIEGSPLVPSRVLGFARQIAEALDAAHRRGIIHRDIKPANLLVCDGDHVKVLDFGLARLAGDDAPGPMSLSGQVPIHATPHGHALPLHLTQTGVAMGTVFYMSPEQARGDPLDARTDLFSLGAVLYEMATGRRAFDGDDIPQVLGKIVNGVFVPPRTLNPGVPRGLDAIIVRLLAADAAQRYQTAGELLADVQRAAETSAPTPAATPNTRHVARDSRGRLLRGAGLAASVVLVAASVGYPWLTRRSAGLTERDSIVIGPFENTTGNAVFDATLAAALRVQLGQSPFLDIVSDQRIGETLRLMGRSAGDALTRPAAREVCQRLGVKAMIEGTVAPLGRHYVLTLSAMDCRTGETLRRMQKEATSTEAVLTALGGAASEMRTALGESLPSIQRFDVPIAQATTPSLAALQAYATGVEERRKGRELESVAFFNQAIALDGSFAQAYATLSAVYGTLGELERSELYARRAYEHQDRVSERERLFIRYQYHDRVTGNQDAAIETLQAWKAAFPRDMQPANALSVVYNRLGEYSRAVDEAKEALRRSPGHPFALSNLAVAYRGLGRYDDARRAAQTAVDLGVETMPTRRLLYQLAVLANDASSSTHLEWARSRSRAFDLMSAEAQVAVYGGRLRIGEDLYRGAAESAAARGLRGTAAGYATHLALVEALYRPGADLPDRVRRLLAVAGAGTEGNQDRSRAPRIRAAVALALAGLGGEAMALMRGAEQRTPASTYVRTALAPSTRAAVALHKGRPDEAIEALEAARATQVGSFGALVPIYLRAEALMQRRAWLDAAREFDTLLRHRGADPFAPVVPLAHLGIARARARAGDVEGSRRAYEELFAIWKAADEDFAPVVAARAEYRRLDDPRTLTAAGRAVRPRG